MTEREIGPYRVKEQVPFRGPGRLFAGVHAVLGRKVSIRELGPGSFDCPGSAGRFLAGTRVVQRHAPAELATVHLCRQEGDGRVLLVTEYLGASLEDRLLRDGPLPLDAALALCRSVLRGVGFLHEAGMPHGSLCAGTVCLSQDGSWKVTGWGLPGEAAPSPGNPPAEEAVAGDLRAVGALLHRMVTGSADGVCAGAGSACPAGLRGLCARALAADPAERFASAGEFLAALELVRQEGGLQAADGAGWEGAQPLLEFPGRRVSWKLLFGLMLVPLVVASLGRREGPLPKVPHREAAGALTEGAAAGGALPGLLPVAKEKVAPQHDRRKPARAQSRRKGPHAGLP